MGAGTTHSDGRSAVRVVRSRTIVNHEQTIWKSGNSDGRLGRVTDIAPLAVFLASDESAWITGEVIRAAGGLVVAT